MYGIVGDWLQGIGAMAIAWVGWKGGTAYWESRKRTMFIVEIRTATPIGSDLYPKWPEQNAFREIVAKFKPEISISGSEHRYTQRGSFDDYFTRTISTFSEFSAAHVAYSRVRFATERAIEEDDDLVSAYLWYCQATSIDQATRIVAASKGNAATIKSCGHGIGRHKPRRTTQAA